MIERAFVTPELESLAWDAASAVVDEALELERNAKSPADALRAMVALYGRAGLLGLVTRRELGGALEVTSSVAVCLVRERLGHASPLAELAFAMQGLGSYPITAARPPEAMSSLYSCPGSRRCTCRSMKPGVTQRPVQSTRLTASPSMPSAAPRPTREITPDSITTSASAS